MDAMTPPEMMQGDPQAMMAQALAPQPKPVTHDVVIVTTKKVSQARVMGVPPEEFGIERGARTIADCNYCFHETNQSVSSLISQGYDEKQVKALASTSGVSDTERLSRDTVDEDSPERDTLNEMARPLVVTEHYIRMDYEGKGQACIYKVTTGGEGGDILRKRPNENAPYKEDIEKVDCYPFAAGTPVPQPHRFFGRSIADLVMQIQREKTAMKRGALDNMYLHNNPRPEIAESHAGVNTIDDLLVSRHGAPIRTKQPGGLAWQVVPDITGSIYPMLQYLDADLEAKTGLSKQTQGIDANALQNQSATAVAQVFSASQLRVKLIARVLAEGVRDMFSLLHGTIRKHGQQQQTVRLRNSWTQIDPRQWKTRQDMTINVGLGTGGKAQQFAQVMALANVQKELIAGGKVNLVDDQALFNMTSELTKIMGYKNPDKFFNDPSAKDPQTGQLLHPPVPPPVDPKVMQIQMQAQLDEKADERKAQIETVQAQADIATTERKMQGEMVMSEREFELKKELAIIDAQLKERIAMAEEARKEREFELKMSLDREKHQMTMAQAEQSHSQGIESKQHDMEVATHKADPQGSGAAMIKQRDTQISALQKTVDSVAVALKELSRPKRIVRGKDGKASHVEPM
jgi:hypothetical protein